MLPVMTTVPSPEGVPWFDELLLDWPLLPPPPPPQLRSNPLDNKQKTANSIRYSFKRSHIPTMTDSPPLTRTAHSYTAPPVTTIVPVLPGPGGGKVSSPQPWENAAPAARNPTTARILIHFFREFQLGFISSLLLIRLPIKDIVGIQCVRERECNALHIAHVDFTSIV